ncbi:MAG: DUF4358 domain-containing protein [Lachnospiraceae bacterium]
MKKRLLALVLALACTVGTISTVTAVEQPVTVEAATKKKAPTVDKIRTAVKNTHSETYKYMRVLSKEDMNLRYGLKESWYSSAKADIFNSTKNIDEVVIVKAKNKSSKNKIKKALKAYLKYQQTEAFLYPKDVPKVQATRIYEKGNYVCYICIGSISRDISESGDEEKQFAAYKAENEKAVKAIKKLF